ncbi:hypothetical protein B0I18_107228 [Taibaiella chishuiensis]|uniref:Uncharacterized protein n=1 Tax=Taibaiella chishuiensis TaxID=1434707 RepID=A0A2P8D0Y5_9BACT|nr:hypothetical protein B0I18_107228 [Taibaiella chishuiensis]
MENKPPWETLKALNWFMSALFEALNAPRFEMSDFGIPAYFQDGGLGRIVNYQGL